MFSQAVEKSSKVVKGSVLSKLPSTLLDTKKKSILKDPLLSPSNTEKKQVKIRISTTDRSRQPLKSAKNVFGGLTRDNFNFIENEERRKIFTKFFPTELDD